VRNALILLNFILLFACERATKSQDLLRDTAPNLEDQWVNMVVEIPTGSNEKWEVNKTTGNIERDSINEQPRTINYLGYPGNYGFIPQTLLPKSAGGDGDPLDILVIGNAVERGKILRCKVIGLLKLIDNGEQDDKLLAVAESSSLSAVNDLIELERQYPGIMEIIETWFAHYKGDGVMVSRGFSTVEEALFTLNTAIKAF
jgi:inorganic pyrophosphatase